MARWKLTDLRLGAFFSFTPWASPHIRAAEKGEVDVSVSVVSVAVAGLRARGHQAQLFCDPEGARLVAETGISTSVDDEGWAAAARVDDELRPRVQRGAPEERARQRRSCGRVIAGEPGEAQPTACREEPVLVTLHRQDVPMPVISRFYGIVIRMYVRGEHPPPHFHVQYGEHRASVSIDDLEVIDGELPARAGKLVREWGSLHEGELRNNWNRARAHEALLPIDPLS